MFLSSVAKMFEKGNVCVTGMMGTGKDLLFGNVIAYRNSPYVSNLNYGGKFQQLDFDKINCSGNTYNELISGDVLYYEYPYYHGSHIYLSDAGLYLPAQYDSQLDKKYAGIALFQPLTRQLAGAFFHSNCQNLTRIWKKLREQSDIFIRCRKCIYLFGLVIQFITIYDKAESCQNRVKPCRVRRPFFNAAAKTQADCYLDNFFNQHGTVKNRILIYFNRSKHDTFHFREYFKNGKKQKENKK